MILPCPIQAKTIKMINIQTYTEEKTADEIQKQQIAYFLLQHLEQFGDPKNDIESAINYAMGIDDKPGGIVIVATEEKTHKILGAAVVNKTGMSQYIPENILVYIATDQNVRGKGIGKTLIQKAIELSQGDIALHCEPDNPAKFLYEKLGFTSKYLEMRLKK